MSQNKMLLLAHLSSEVIRNNENDIDDITQTSKNGCHGTPIQIDNATFSVEFLSTVNGTGVLGLASFSRHLNLMCEHSHYYTTIVHEQYTCMRHFTRSPGTMIRVVDIPATMPALKCCAML